MAYLDSAGNVSDLTVQNWQQFHRKQQIVPQAVSLANSIPSTALPAGAEKASKGTH
jgi:hypothetical protein